jgi:hypothetical protein
MKREKYPSFPFERMDVCQNRQALDFRKDVALPQKQKIRCPAPLSFITYPL